MSVIASFGDENLLDVPTNNSSIKIYIFNVNLFDFIKIEESEKINYIQYKTVSNVIIESNSDGKIVIFKTHENGRNDSDKRVLYVVVPKDSKINFR